MKKDRFDGEIVPLLLVLATNNNDVNECKKAVRSALSEQMKHYELALKIDYLFCVLELVNSIVNEIIEQFKPKKDGFF